MTFPLAKPQLCANVLLQISNYGTEMFSTLKKGLFKKELLTYKLKLIVPGADSYIVREHG